MKKRFLPFLTLLLLLVPMTATATTPQVIQAAQVTVNAPLLTIYSVTPYDNGVVITMSYTNFTAFAQSKSSFKTDLYVYFLNSTTKYLMYKSETSSISFAFAYVNDGKLYVVVDTSPGPNSGQSSYQTDVYVFEGLRLVNTYTINGLMLYSKGQNVEGLYNVSAPILMRAEPTFPHFSVDFIVMLNETNITLVDSIPIVLLQLPEGILVASYNISNALPIGRSSTTPLNVTLFGYDGRIIWTKKYIIGMITSSAPFSNPSLVPTEYAVIVGDQLFFLNASTPLPATTISYGFMQPQNVTLNATLVGVSLEDGNITTRVSVSNITPDVYLLNIGGQLNVLIVGQKEAVIERFNGTGLMTVAKVPLVLKVKRIVVGGYVEDNRTIYKYANFTEVATYFLYNPGKYLLIVNPTVNGSDVTDVYTGGIMKYSIAENASRESVTPYTLLLNESDNFSLAFLNDNGTVRGFVNLGNLTSHSLFSLFTAPGVRVVKVNDYEYYVIKESSNSTNSTTITLYEVEFPKPTPPAPTTSAVTPTVSSPVNALVIVAIVVVAVVVVGVVIALRRRK